MDLLRVNDPGGAYPPSYYHATANAFEPCPPLDGDVSVHVCIIGAGFTGLSAALYLSGKGMDVLVLDANRVGWGASGRNGGQLGSGQRLGQQELEKTIGADHGRQLWDLAEEAKKTVRGYIAEHRIECGLRSGLIHGALNSRAAEAAKTEVAHLQEHLDYDKLSILDTGAIRRALGTRMYVGGVLDEGAGHLHPLNFALGMATAARERGVRIHEMTRVVSVGETSPHVVKTESGSITAERVIYACNGYHGGIEPRAAARIMPINNFIVTTEPLGREQAKSLIRDNVAVNDSKFVVNYFRLTEDDRMLFGGGETYGYKFPGDIAAKVRPNMLKVYPQLKDAKIEHAWGGTLGITRSRLPYFRAHDSTRLFAGGFSGHGVAMATQAGKLMAQYVVGTPEGFDAFAKLTHDRFPGGAKARHPLLVLAMSWYALRDRLGV
ncbi:MAG: FAD-binding oxidoreductase [Pseudomonadota bacterium]